MPFREKLTRVVITPFESRPDDKIVEKEFDKLKKRLIEEYGEPTYVDTELCKKAPYQYRQSEIIVWIMKGSVLTLSVGFRRDNVPNESPCIGIGYGDYKNDPVSKHWRWLEDRAK